MENYQHPPTFRSTGDISADFRHSAADYDVNVAQHLFQNRDARIVDVGCGWGQFVWWLRNRGYVKIEGIAVGNEQVRQCEGLGLKVQQVSDSAAFLREFEGQFDIVSMHHIIEHVETAEGLKLLRAAHSCLKPGGRIIIQTPNMNATSAN